MEGISSKIFVGILSLFLLTYVGYQAYRYVYNPIKTETVLSYTVQDTKRVKGLLVREEQQMEQPQSGVVNYYYDDGVKVSASSAVAEIHSNEQDVKNKRRIAEIDSELEHLEDLQNTGDSYYLNTEAITKQINENLYSIIQSNDSQNLLDIGEKKSELLTNLNRKQLATNVVDNFDNKIQALQEEKASLQGQIQSSPMVVEAGSVGYFSSYSDGMEDELTVDRLESMTVGELQGYLDDTYEQDDSVMGKLITDMNWYLLVLLPSDEAESLTQGEKLEIDFGIPSYDNVPAEIVSVREEKGSNQSIVTFKCQFMCSQLTRMRNPSVELIFEKYTGLKIPKSALRFVDNQKGVYIKSGNTILFRKVDEVYTDTGYILSRMDSPDTDLVQMYDEIVTEGTDLQDGKVIGST